jgi:calmodulin
MFDKDKTGSITASELRGVCELLNLKVSDGEIQKLMTLMDKDNSGSIEFDEFANVLGKEFYRTPSKQELESVFDYFDQGEPRCFIC